MALLKAGTRLKSAVCATEVMVIAAPKEDVAVSCGGAAMLGMSDPKPDGGAVAADASGGTLHGKRYVSAGGDLELLCTKAGQGALAANGAALGLKEAKPLPSSD
jgi:hypothetical protein